MGICRHSERAAEREDRDVAMFTIMIIEDDLTIANELKEELEKWSYEAFYVTKFHNVLSEFIEKQPQMVIIDIKLPYFNGFYWCQEIRKISQVPILFISSQNENMDIVMAIQLGADDFISKPFDLSVALAKVQALLRRAYDFKGNDDYLRYGDGVLKPKQSQISCHNRQADLTRNEMKIMEILFQKKGEFVSREEIMVKLWEDESFIDDNTLAVNVARLRKKIAEIGLHSFIVTKKGVGYGLSKVNTDETDY